MSGPDRYRDMILSTGTEEIGHIELLATAVSMSPEGARPEQVDEIVTTPMVAARMGAPEPRHFLSSGVAAMPSDANGVPFNAACIDAGGNLIANMRANVAAEAISRRVACRLLEMTDHPGTKDMLRFLIARDTMHQQQWLGRARGARARDATNAPGDFENTGEFADHAYEFINHHLDAQIDRMRASRRGRRSAVRASSASSSRASPRPRSRRCRRRRPRATPVSRPPRATARRAVAGWPRASRAWRRTSPTGSLRTRVVAGGRDYEAMTKEELLEEARRADVEGRSSWTRSSSSSCAPEARQS